MLEIEMKWIYQDLSSLEGKRCVRDYDWIIDFRDQMKKIKEESVLRRERRWMWNVLVVEVK